MTIGNFPPGIDIQDIKGCGTSGMAALDPITGYIIKFPLGDDDELARCDQERRIYHLLKSSIYKRPSSLLQFHGSTSHGILLDYAEFGPVRKFIRSSAHPIQISIVLQWAQQAAEALEFVHANGICHGDINCTNFFLDHQLNLKLGDFTSSTDSVTARDLQEDISNYGSALYEIAIGHPPYPNLSLEEREQRFQAKVFPDLAKAATLKSLILRCWTSEYTSMGDILRDINIARMHTFPPRLCHANPIIVRRHSLQSSLAKAFGSALFIHVFEGSRR